MLDLRCLLVVVEHPVVVDVPCPVPEYLEDGNGVDARLASIAEVFSVVLAFPPSLSTKNDQSELNEWRDK